MSELSEYLKLVSDIHDVYSRRRLRNKEDYLSLISLVESKFGKPGPMRERGRFMLRHDVDRDIINAIELAYIEFEHGIRSTYFLLPSSDYYKNGVLRVARQIAACGHEIGLHNDTISTYYKLKESGFETTPEQIMKDELEDLRRYFDIVGTASHGNTVYCRRYNYTNYDIFRKEEWGPLKMEDYGLEYEAYYVGNKYYISDSGGLMAFEEKNTHLFREDRCTNDMSFILEKVKECEPREDESIQVLIHPEWWNFSEEENG